MHPANQENLFSTNEILVKGYDLPDADIILYENLFTREESDKLLMNLKENIKWQQDQIKLYGKKVDLPRLTAYYGGNDKPYSYSGITMNPNPWNEVLLFIKNKIEEKAGVEFTSCLLNYYRSGKDSMGWHQDNEKELGQNPVIGSVSIGETRVFQLKHLQLKDLNTVQIPLKHGSFLLMRGSTQNHWKHCIPKTSKALNARINLTFRIIA